MIFWDDQGNVSPNTVTGRDHDHTTVPPDTFWVIVTDINKPHAPDYDSMQMESISQLILAMSITQPSISFRFDYDHQKDKFENYIGTYTIFSIFRGIPSFSSENASLYASFVRSFSSWASVHETFAKEFAMQANYLGFDIQNPQDSSSLADCVL